MTRMNKEFSLVLLGAGLLTAGYFLWPEEDLEARANDELHRQVGASSHSSTRHRTSIAPFIFLHSARSGFARSPVSSGISRGGFGSTGHSMSGIS